MLKQKFIAGVAVAATLIIGIQASTLAFSGKAKKQVSFKVRIENVSKKDGLMNADGSKYPFALSPGSYAVTKQKLDIFKAGSKASGALEAQAEDGNPEILSSFVVSKAYEGSYGIFNTPVGADMPSPILPDGVFEFTFNAGRGMKLNLVAMYGQSNDLFYAPVEAIDLFDAKGNPVNGDITGEFQLWDAGTEVNQTPGIGPDQAPRQMMKNMGAAENGVVHMAKDGFAYPNTKDVLRITITVQ